MRSTIVGKSLRIAAIATGLAFAGVAAAAPISTAFNFVPTGTITCNNANITLATSCSPGAPDVVTTIAFDNTGLISLVTTINLTNPTPLTLGAAFTKSFTTALGTFTELLTVTNVSIGASSLSILASGTISCVGLCTGLTGPVPVFYSASYTQNLGPGTQINASFNNSTTPVPEPGTLALLGLGLAAIGFGRRHKA